jgi:hypothetical protein
VSLHVAQGGDLPDDVTGLLKGVQWDVVCGEMLLEP